MMLNTLKVQITGCSEAHGCVTPFVSNQRAQFFGVYLGVPGAFEHQDDHGTLEAAYVHARELLEADHARQLDDRTFDTDEEQDWLDVAETMHSMYTGIYGSNPQGCCLLLADAIQKEIGGDVVAGELWWYGGTCRRTHWWVEKDGLVIDPMGKYLLSFEEATGRTEHHRDRNVFNALLPQYEKWRIGASHGKVSE